MRASTVGVCALGCGTGRRLFRRGCCGPCYDAARRAGTVHQLPDRRAQRGTTNAVLSLPMPLPDLLEEAAHFLGYRWPLERVATYLGVDVGVLRTVLAAHDPAALAG